MYSQSITLLKNSLNKLTLIQYKETKGDRIRRGPKHLATNADKGNSDNRASINSRNWISQISTYRNEFIELKFLIFCLRSVQVTPFLKMSNRFRFQLLY